MVDSIYEKLNYWKYGIFNNRNIFIFLCGYLNIAITADYIDIFNLVLYEFTFYMLQFVSIIQ